MVGHNTSMIDAFKKADEVLLNAVQGISDLMTVPGLINVDFADVRTIMSGMGRALMGSGVSVGKRRAVEAAEMAISSPLLEDVSIEGATGILINITGGPDLTLFEVNEASTLIQEAAHEDANIIFGSVIDANVGDEVRITVIATGFDRLGKPAIEEKPLFNPVPPTRSRAPQRKARARTVKPVEQMALPYGSAPAAPLAPVAPVRRGNTAVGAPPPPPPMFEAPDPDLLFDAPPAPTAWVEEEVLVDDDMLAVERALAELSADEPLLTTPPIVSQESSGPIIEAVLREPTSPSLGIPQVEMSSPLMESSGQHVVAHTQIESPSQRLEAFRRDVVNASLDTPSRRLGDMHAELPRREVSNPRVELPRREVSNPRMELPRRDVSSARLAVGTGPTTGKSMFDELSTPEPVTHKPRSRRMSSEFPRLHPSLRNSIGEDNENELDVPTFIRRQTPR